MEYVRLVPGRGFRPVRSICYYSQRVVTSPGWRRRILGLLKKGVALRGGAMPLNDALPAHFETALAELGKSGFAPLQTLLDERKIREIEDYLRDKPVNSRNRSGGYPLGAAPSDISLADYSIADIIHCPHILELANDPSLLSFAARYLGCKPTISALVLRRSFPGNGTRNAVQRFHRDAEDWRYLKVFVYLSDVDQDSGPHVYVKQTHLNKIPLRLRFHDDDEVGRVYGEEQVAVVTGARGFGFAADTAGIHKGMVPKRRERLLLTIQYSVLPCFAYKYQPIAAGQHGTRFDPYINRLFIKR